MARGARVSPARRVCAEAERAPAPVKRYALEILGADAMAPALQYRAAEVRSMKKILVALDGSPRESAVLDAAVRMAGSLKAALVLARVVGIPIDMPLELVRVTPADFEKQLQARATDALKEMAKRIPKNVEWTSQVVSGVPWDSICWLAKDEDVDLVVIGAHGYGRLDRLIGTTASRVVNHADRSVLVVRHEERLEAEKATKAQ
jgi:nucleotide-binding universal stress UspA family protein